VPLPNLSSQLTGAGTARNDRLCSTYFRAVLKKVQQLSTRALAATIASDSFCMSSSSTSNSTGKDILGNASNILRTRPKVSKITIKVGQMY
jgi:hypothetical protein